jgi:hypothetical protein
MQSNIGPPEMHQDTIELSVTHTRLDRITETEGPF